MLTEISDQRPYHDVHIPNTFQGVVDAPVGHLSQDFADGSIVILGVDKFSGAEYSGLLSFLWIGVNSDDPFGSCKLAAHDCSQTHSPHTKDCTRGARLNLERRQ